ncbi:hypothetical protein ACFV9W_03465 [Streptomyces sp. NPDC059897]|uniref:hypothetical protein n=1 Tax=Streptomyces sp. NPDC059897 TaxID=3346994 RepID=UPI003655D04E
MHTSSAIRMALEAASQFAPFCVRQIVMTKPLGRLAFPELLLDFGVYGTGVVPQRRRRPRQGGGRSLPSAPGR